MTSNRKSAALLLLPLMASLCLRCSPPETQTPSVAPPKEGISLLLPESDEVENWTEFDLPQQVEGEDLFTLINGGAEIYHEYGFRQAVNHSYESNDGKAINVEIYEMASPESAFGIYSFKTGDEGEEVPFGNNGLLESYYLNFWKGNYLVTLVGFDTEPETVEIILEMARLVDSKIEGGGDFVTPAVVRCLPTEGLNRSTVVYLKGNMALLDNYELDTGNIFGVEEGVIGDYGESRIFIFSYENEETAVKWFQNGRDQLRDDSDFTDFIAGEDHFSATDSQGDSLYVKPSRNTVVIVLGGAGEDAPRVFAEVAENIARQIP